MSQQEPSLVRPDHADTLVSVTGEDTGFQPSFTPENVPKLSVPDLPDDATGLSPEALAQVPTLTDQVHAPEPEATQASSAAEPVLPVLEPLPQDHSEAEPSAATEVLAQETQEPAAEADTWLEQMQVRMDRLMDDIHTLNDRLDRLENKTKV